MDIVATTNTDGELVLTSESGLNIEVLGGSEDDIFDAAQSEKGCSFYCINSDFTAFGTMTLTSDDGSVIVMEDGEADTHTGLATLGLKAQSEHAAQTTTGLAVSTTAQASSALASLDTAIDKVSRFRAVLVPMKIVLMQPSII